MSAPRVGDRVRVVIEGEVMGSAGGPTFRMQVDADWYWSIPINPACAGVSVEVIARPLKVGDTIEGEQYESAPVGTVVERPGFSIATMKVEDGRWHTSDHCEFASSSLGHVRRTVVYIPEATK